MERNTHSTTDNRDQRTQDTETNSLLTRRHALRALGAAGIASIAGCNTGSDGETPSDVPTETDDSTPTETEPPDTTETETKTPQPPDERIAYTGFNSPVYVHDIKTQDQLHAFPDGPETVDTVALSDQYIAYGGDDGKVWVRDSEDGSVAYEFPYRGRTVTAVALNDQYIAYSGLAEYGWDSNDLDEFENLYVRDLSDGSIVFKTMKSRGSMQAVALTDEYLVYEGEEGTVEIHSVGDWEPVQTLTDAREGSLARIDGDPEDQDWMRWASPDDVAITDTHIAFPAWKTVHVYRLSDWTKVQEISHDHPDLGDSEMLTGVSISGNYIGFSAEDGYAYLHELDTGERVHQFTRAKEEDNDHSRAIELGSEYVAYGGSRGYVYVHSLKDFSFQFSLIKDDEYRGGRADYIKSIDIR